jgi:hypothetical protein
MICSRSSPQACTKVNSRDKIQFSNPQHIGIYRSPRGHAEYYIISIKGPCDAFRISCPSDTMCSLIRGIRGVGWCRRRGWPLRDSIANPGIGICILHCAADTRVLRRRAYGWGERWRSARGSKAARSGIRERAIRIKALSRKLRRS